MLKLYQCENGPCVARRDSRPFFNDNEGKCPCCKAKGRLLWDSDYPRTRPGHNTTQHITTIYLARTVYLIGRPFCSVGR